MPDLAAWIMGWDKVARILPQRAVNRISGLPPEIKRKDEGGLLPPFPPRVPIPGFPEDPDGRIRFPSKDPGQRGETRARYFRWHPTLKPV